MPGRAYNGSAMNAASNPTFYLFWLRESGCDAGTPVTAAELPASIQDRILQLAGSSSSLHLRLPYLNRIEERHAEDALAGVAFERTGDPNRRRPDISLISSSYGWTPTVGLREGLDRMIRSYRDDEGIG